MFVLFKIFPLIPYDGDDWYFIGTMRNPWPMWGVFNPSKVFPEVLEPLVGYFGAFFIYPITHNYVFSLSFTSVLVVSGFITLLMVFTYKYLRKKYNLSRVRALSLEIFFYLSFFMLFKKINGTSYFGFWCQDLNCYFNYLIPGCLNASLLMFFETADNNLYSLSNKQHNLLVVGILVTVIYFAMFSSIQLNVILASYAIIKLMFSFKKDNGWHGFKQNWPFVFIIIAWIVSLIFDSHGRRATVVSSHGNRSLLVSLGDVINQYMVMMHQTNHLFFIICILIIFGALCTVLIQWWKGKQIEISDYLITIALSLMTLCYSTLLYTKAPATYASRPDAMWALVFLGLFLTVQGLAVLLNEFNKTTILIPSVIVLMALISFNFNNGYVYKDSNDAFTSYKLDNYIINKIVSAEHRGKSSVKVKVPKDNKNGNWPHPFNEAQWMQNTLYAHRMIRHRIYVEFVPDQKLNKHLYPQGDTQPFNNLEVR